VKIEACDNYVLDQLQVELKILYEQCLNSILNYRQNSIKRFQDKICWQEFRRANTYLL